MLASFPDLQSIAAGGKRGLSRALALIETHEGTAELAELLDAALAQTRAHTAGLTGPPGVGKSTLTNALICDWRGRGETLGVIAVDPSSRRTGGALLGDRARMATDPEDQGVFVRSMAARDRLGGLSDQTIAAAALMRALFDRVLIESVGIGQSEADISFAVDSVILCVQPGSGDSLQFMKAGVMELPDIVVVTKADMGDAAKRAKSEVEGALTLFERDDDWRVPVILASAASGAGMAELHKALADHRAWAERGGALKARRAAQEKAWVEQSIRARFGSEGFSRASSIPFSAPGPFTRELEIARELTRLLQKG
ncbi:methylmalonyl Co-A mutase-associated GTPase MeaB [Rhodoblastus acidophilus]|uniref:Methylmalonyl Co-A mutase-associated GTPase MeaB n=1 Tax=Candidatus Rhodoblastus alkanivorans TaxID=2954117 RepID=A0ABS9ZAS1_9HYPH|nr:methylmalonyl Co-A mutase-associated GTPase MeaB [Candidatus Rhodoblastus alkanivorans]MCI4678925.1 methylmalonyl Co-A mutase-associated GTPase MeaB [Candidatus Rhodoblastus alkanivorans]MCI4684151.1 methylmalonyl Co-A mutase-associated GTPase MeaB [Candidatus Rhodoblastus alkanivorans]MDI4641472.1 methylmalonyl Co-A mutase-associated GTPase MeaB [Rhodoblastus acidophilus]